MEETRFEQHHGTLQQLEFIEQFLPTPRVLTELFLLYLGVVAGLDAHVEPPCVRHVGTQVDDDGPRRVKPLQGALRAAQVDLFHVTAVRLVAQTTADKEGGQIRLIK